MFENWCPFCTPFTISILVFEKRDFFRNLDFSFYLLLGRKIQNRDKIRRMTHVLPIRCWRATFSSLFILLDGRVETQSAWETILIYCSLLFSLSPHLYFYLWCLYVIFLWEGRNKWCGKRRSFIYLILLIGIISSFYDLAVVGEGIEKTTTTTTFLFPV